MIRGSLYSQSVIPVTRTRIKICGITSPQDACAAADHGADAIGLVFYPGSPRAVTVTQAEQIVDAVAPFVTVVALVVDEPADAVWRIVNTVPVDLIQFHGEEPAAYCQQFNRPWMKALRVRAGMDLTASCDDYRGARAVLLDSWQAGVPGGTGKTFDWGLARGDFALPLVLAGGLNEGNVSDAIARLRPAAVDVSGGVERSPGRKDTQKIKRFIAAVRAADVSRDGAADDD